MSGGAAATSHPAWVCGLKLICMSCLLLLIVTPCVGVWIETALKDLASDIDRSHPAWVCGLKRVPLDKGEWVAGSHTLRGCVD